MIVREATPGDVAAVVELAALLGHDLDPEGLASRLWSDGLPTLVAEVDGKVVGLCGLSMSVHLHRDSPVGRITILVVAPAMRGRGIGSALVDEAERRLAAVGCGMVEVTSNFRLEQGHAFYEARGFTRSSFRFFRAL